jgi:Tannase and feruloyl esterase
MGKFAVVGLVGTLMVCTAHGQTASSGMGACEQLTKLALTGAKVTSVKTVAAGAFAAHANATPWLEGAAEFYKGLPAFCRVQVTATPSKDSDIKIEVWMPSSGWNGKFQGQGNGGFAGEIDHRSMGAAMSEGYATAGTDTGHSAAGTDARWALGHPEKVTDFGYRSIHEMTRIGKEVTKGFYGNAARKSYFASCSNGGRQGLMEAQRYPQDYDGILAGAPANYWSHLLTNALYNVQVTMKPAESYIPASKLEAIATAVNDVCDAQDGVKDGVLNDPRQCHFDPAVLLCKEGDSEKCLTAAQVTTLKKLYEGGSDSQGKRIFPGYLPGAEEGRGGWAIWITGTAPGKSLMYAFGVGFFSDMIYQKADWDYKDARIDEAEAAADQAAKTFNATDPNLAVFHERGGKLILYHGWNDAAISALNTLDYYHSVAQTMGVPVTESFVRVFMVPGMQHCSDGPGANSFGQGWASPAKDPRKNMRLALEKWVEDGAAPDTVIATKYVSDEDHSQGVKMTRPLCAYPQTAKYRGSGDTNDAANFVCVAGGE